MATALNYMGVSYLISYGTATLKIDAATVLGAGILGAVTIGTGIIVGGTISDYLGRRKVILTANILGCAWALVLFPLLNTGSIVAFWVGLSISTLIAGLAFGVAGSYLSELYQTQYRYTAAALAYSFGQIIGGAIPPLVAGPVIAAFGGYAFSVLLALLCLISVICAFVLKETSQRDLDDITAPTAALAE
jgi:MFS family permease